MIRDEICFMPATELAAKIAAGEVSAVEVMRAFLERIDRLNPRLNAFVTLCSQQAQKRALEADAHLARGNQPRKLHGVPFSVKDILFTAGVRTTAGSRVHENFVPTQDAVVVARLRAAGAILLGKTNTPEFGYKATTENQLFGATRNPWQTEYTPGGSSGGAAAATAAGLSPLSVGTDGGGSIRIPASFCGTFGLKPTFSLIPSLPGFPGWRTLSHIGPITRTVRDAALMLDVIAGQAEVDPSSIPRTGSSYLQELDVPLPKLRIGYSRDLGFAQVTAEVVRVVEDALSVFKDMGHTVEQLDMDLGRVKHVFETICLGENAAVHRTELEEYRDLMDKAFVKFVERGIGLSAADYVDATLRRDEITALVTAYFRNQDILVTPTVAVPPFPIGSPPRELGGVSIEPIDWIPFTYPFNLTGNPAANVPCGMTSNGLPIGLQIVGPRHADGKVLNVCVQFEAARPWAHLRPPIN